LDGNEVWMLHGEEYTRSGDRSSGLFAPGSLGWRDIGRSSVMEGLTPEGVSALGEEGSAGINACVRQAGQRIDGAEGDCWRACV
jgi:hypothetical protein